VRILSDGLFQVDPQRYTAAILNPPYKKIRSESEFRQLLRGIGIETSNLYTAFLALVVSLLEREGEFVSITPRSFCNGPYFKPFREHLLKAVDLRQIMVFEGRDDAFHEDEVLQENVIMHGVKRSTQSRTVLISQARTPEDKDLLQQKVPFDRVVHPDDQQRFIRLVPEETGRVLANTMESLPCGLKDLGLEVSTGRVVDFRARSWLRREPEACTVPLIYPSHFVRGTVSWPKIGGRKPNSIRLDAKTSNLLTPAGVYVLVKRFSSKEEPRRVVAAVFNPAEVLCEYVGFENHLNYFHASGNGLDLGLAWGLMAFLNSSQLDTYFRQFNGHTQVNATDLRSLRYPCRAALIALGERIKSPIPSQSEIDAIVAQALQAVVVQ